MRISRTPLLCCVGVIAAGSAYAHFSLVQPASAIAFDDGGKGAPPCGEGPPSNIVTDAQGGHPLALKLSEFVFHPGHYRIALSVNSRAELPADPNVTVNSFGDSVSAAVQNPVKAPVLADGLFAHTSPPAADWQTSVVLPNLNCERCTLQVIQFMAEHGPNPGGGYFYHHCADLRITADPNLPPADSSWPRGATQVRSVFPHVIAGGGWSTGLTLINTSGDAVSANVSVHGDVPFPATDVTINSNGTVVVPIGDSGSSGGKGWAEVRSTGAVSGFEVLRSTAQEASLPLQSQFATSMTLPFDNTAGFATTVTMVNPSAAAVTVVATVLDEAGTSIATRSIPIAANGRVEFSLTDQAAASAGKRGIIQLQASGGIAAVALRMGASGSFVVLPPL